MMEPVTFYLKQIECKYYTQYVMLEAPKKKGMTLSQNARIESETFFRINFNLKLVNTSNIFSDDFENLKGVWACNLQVVSPGLIYIF